MVSTGQFRPIAILVQDLGIGEGVGIVDGAVVHHFPHRQLYYLAGLGAGMASTCRMRAGMTGGAVLLLFAGGSARVALIQLAARLELDEQHHSLVLFPLLADDDALSTSSSCST